jgi:hypothetical protein
VFPLKFCEALPGSKTYQQDTQECSRINYQTLQDWDYFVRDQDTKCHFGHAIDTFFPRLVPKLRITRHLQERLRGYVDCLSKNGDYYELLPTEYEYLQNLRDRIAEQNLYLVQIGFNQRSEICKIAWVTQFPAYVSNRWLFLCVGTDGGVKTLYVTPEYKHRKRYQESGNIHTWEFPDLQAEYRNLSNFAPTSL